MRRWMTVSALSVVGALFAACGDDEGPAPGTGGSSGSGGSAGSAGSGGSAGNAGSAGTGGSSGSAGTGGSAGTAGSAGTGGGSGSAGTGGSAGTAGSAGSSGSGNQPDAGDAGVEGDGGDAAPPPPCTGCLELRAPFTAINQAGYFQVASSVLNLADTVVTFRVRAQTLDETGQLFVTAFGTDGTTDGFVQGNGTFTVLNAAAFTNTETFIDITLDFSAITTVGFNDEDVIAFGLQLGSGATFVPPRTAVLLLDSITFTGTSGLTNLDFTTDAQGVTTNAFAGIQTTEIIHH